MSATKIEIHGWLLRAKQQGASHLIVMCDTFDYEDYPVYVMPGEDPRSKVPTGDMQQVMEVYCLALDLEAQLAEHRAMHWEHDSIHAAVKAELKG